jgi:Predicted metal-binding protein
MTRIAMISCDNVKNECNCAGEGCLRSFNKKIAVFDRYKDEDIELVGYSTCAGCPTIYAHEKILKKVKPLVEVAKADKIHFSSCMVKLCPFVHKYKQVINEAYPDVEVVLGTDAYPDQPLETMTKIFKKLLTDTNNDITEEFKKVMESAKYKEIVTKEEA